MYNSLTRAVFGSHRTSRRRRMLGAFLIITAIAIGLSVGVVSAKAQPPLRPMPALVSVGARL